MAQLDIFDTAVLIGFSPEGECVYSAMMPLGDYWDGEHAWDSTVGLQELRLQTLKGYLFDSTGQLLQEFESTFNLSSGIFERGWARHADRTYQEHQPHGPDA
jgi:hypothetical protein